MAAPRSSLASSSQPVRCEHCHSDNCLISEGLGFRHCQACAWITPEAGATSRGNIPSVQQPPIPALPFPLGTVLRERYRLEHLLGAGAQGITYAAEHQFLNQPCAVKVLHSRLADEQQLAAEQLRAEAATGFQINHANVVRVLDCDVVADHWFFVTELITGCDLSQICAVGLQLNPKQAAMLLLEACSGLEAIHQAEILHRDLKPSNMLLGADGHLRLADFGVAAALARCSAPGSKATGTLAYAPPEVVTGGHPPEFASDIYSLGAAFYHLLSGQLPRGQSVFRNLMSEDSPINWPDSAELVPSWLRELIQRMMHPVPEQRPSSVAEIVEVLRGHLGQGLASHSAMSVAQPASNDGALTPVGVVVLPFDCNANDESHHWLGQALSDHLTRALASRGQIFVAEADPFLATVQRVSPRFPNDQIGQWREAGRLSGAAFVIAGSFSHSGDSLQVQVAVHSSTKAQPSREETFTGRLTKLVALEEELYRFAAQAIGVEGSAIPDAPASGRSAELEEMFFAAKQAFQRGDYEVAMQRAKSAHELAQQDGDILGLIGICYARMGQYDEAVSYHEQQHALAVSANDARQRVEAHANLGSMYYFKGEFPAADRWLTQAADAAESHGFETELALIRNNLGYVRLQLGRLESAEEAYQTAIRIHRRHGALTQLIGPYNGIGHILLKRERYEEARGYFQRALSLSQQSSDQVNMGVAYMNLGYCAVELGELQSAKHELAIALNVLEYTTFWNGLARVYDYMVRLNTRLSHWTEALRCAEQRITLAKRHKNEKIEADAREQYEQTARLAAGSSR